MPLDRFGTFSTRRNLHSPPPHRNPISTTTSSHSHGRFYYYHNGPQTSDDCHSVGHPPPASAARKIARSTTEPAGGQPMPGSHVISLGYVRRWNLSRGYKLFNWGGYIVGGDAMAKGEHALTGVF